MIPIRRYLFLLLMISLFLVPSLIAQEVTVYGKVYDSSNHEPIIGVTVFSGNKGGYTDNNGFYSLKLPTSKSQIIHFSFVGYERKELTIIGERDTLLNVFLVPNINVLQEVVVKGKSINRKLGVIALPMDRIFNQPTLLAEPDPVKSIQNIPGVQYANEGQSGSVIRGQAPEMNNLIVDGVSIYNSNHALGLLSTINPETVKRVSLYKSYQPVNQTGRMGGVIEIQTKDGNTERYEGNISLGLVSMRGNIEIPIVKSKTSLSISGRRSMIDLFMPLLNKKDNEPTNFSFYDSNIKITHRCNNRLTLSAGGIISGDKLWIIRKKTDYTNIANKQIWKWGTFGANISANFIPSSKWNSKLQIVLSNYRRKEEVHAKSVTNTNNYVCEIAAKWDNSIYFSSELSLKTGLGATKRVAIMNRNDKISAYDIYSYIESIWQASSFITTKTGIRLEYPFIRLLPRFAIEFMLTPHLSFEGVFSRNSQRTLTASSNNSFLQVDTWFFPNPNFKPSISNQYSLSTKWQISDDLFFMVGGYYIIMNNLIDYKEGYTKLDNYHEIDEKLTTGRGKSLGLETQLCLRKNNLQVDVNYTYSHIRHFFKEINEGESFRPYYDRPHKLSLNLSYSLGKHWMFAVNGIYSSGNIQTIPLELLPAAVSFPNKPIFTIEQIYKKNNFRLPSYHRIDISANYRIKNWRITASVYNVYNRQNVYRAIIEENKNIRKIKGMTLLPIIPGINIKYSF